MLHLGNDCNQGGQVDGHRHHHHHDHDAGAQGGGQCSQGSGQNNPVEMFQHILQQLMQGQGQGQGC